MTLTKMAMVKSLINGGTDCDDTNALSTPLQIRCQLQTVSTTNCDGKSMKMLKAGDLDGDGVDVFDGDCDDNDPSVYPGADDAWYDGVDSDCAGNDDFDQDGDGQIPLQYGGQDCDDGDSNTYAGLLGCLV